MRRRLTGAFVALAVVVAPVGVAKATSFNVKDYGAKGDGRAIDSVAIDKAIAAASAAGNGIVEIPPGTYLSRSIHLKSNITINLQQGARIVASGSGIDAPEPNPTYRRYQDFGHSHFRNALLWGENVENINFTGKGVIDGANKLETGENIPAGKGDKMLSLKFCKNVNITGVTFREAGHFAIITNGCNGMKLDRITVDSPEDRDGINFINSSNIELSNSTIVSSDDAVAFKSDYATGRTFLSENNVVRDSTIESTENNAVQFGSETCGSFRNIQFRNLRITGASKAGLGMVSMDGAVIEDVLYDNIQLTKTGSPIYLHVGKRGRCPDNPPTGKIRNITYRNITGTNLTAPRDIPGDPEYASTVSGRSDSKITGLTFDRVKLTVPGNHKESDAVKSPPEVSGEYPPRIFGVRPAFGFWIRNATDVKFLDSTIEFDRNDGRPAFTTDGVQDISLNGVKVERSTGATDLQWRKSSGTSVTNSTTTSGQALRARNG
ncbi:glycosyl hydrolase family 28 protein [Lentzea sp. BCCO 10_0798]|uniref:Glycosyl hydrolase family 28 protein n=1 Tax=Lentzea kristufekii TaxID=3095430 RepID=A0ABU4U3J2_9PSEU|nr:glycosyl hydrolase family 28 protein [Lentzea sp. BCCO 10_0798]MDX8055148.1 glycosyl hydrolase family 28 protein [Lentzea sp. BCCO 10_0798]